MQRAVIACHESQIEVGDLGLYDSHIALDYEINTIDQDRQVVPLEDFERRYILKVLKITDWRVSGPRGAAVLLGLPPSTLYSKMKKLRIKRP